MSTLHVRAMSLAVTVVVATQVGCSADEETPAAVFEPREVIDLGALVTPDLPERVWGRAMLEATGFTRPNEFDVIRQDYEMPDGSVSTSSAYYTLYNHGGPHVDAPNHVSVGPGLDSYPVESFAGPLKVFDVKGFPLGRSIGQDVFAGSVEAGDIVLIFTGYAPPASDEALPETTTLTRDAAEYLATLPVRAFGTDALSVATANETRPVVADSELARAVPIHHSFLSRGIPVYEQLFNVDRLVERSGSALYFVGVPLNIKDGDGMIVRPIVFVY